MTLPHVQCVSGALEVEDSSLRTPEDLGGSQGASPLCAICGLVGCLLNFFFFSFGFEYELEEKCAINFLS